MKLGADLKCLRILTAIAALLGAHSLVEAGLAPAEALKSPDGQESKDQP